MTRPLRPALPVLSGLFPGCARLILDSLAAAGIESAPLSPAMEPLLFPALGAPLALGLLVLSLHLRRKHRFLRDTPTSKAHGVFIGQVELEGTAECATPVRSYLAGTECVLFGYRVEERWSRLETETYRDSKGNTRTRVRRKSGWTTVASDGHTQPFYVRDDTGVVLVRPDRAKLEPAPLFDQTVSRGDALYFGKGPAGAVANSDGVRRFVEEGIPLHAPLFVAGRARERGDVVAPEIAADDAAELFLISTRTEDKVARGYAFGSWTAWFFGLAVAVGAAFGWVGAQGHPPAATWPAAAAAAFLGLWALAWVWMAYNSLVALRERVRQGWSLIDVQLKRRHDLIPSLVAALGAWRGHEAGTQAAIAALRTQAVATPPGVAGPDFHGLARSVTAVVERYPELGAAPGFRALHEELVRTEQRIALARAYYNDIATHFATRLEQVPDRWVAALGGMRPEPLLGAADFERAPVTVDLTPNP